MKIKFEFNSEQQRIDFLTPFQEQLGTGVSLNEVQEKLEAVEERSFRARWRAMYARSSSYKASGLHGAQGIKSKEAELFDDS